MADDTTGTVATVAPMVSYAIMPLASVPRRLPPERKDTWNKEQADALLAAISGPAIEVDGKPSPPTATDGTAYADLKAARTAANRAKRLVARILPTDKIAKTAIFGLDKKGQAVQQADSAGTYGFAIWLTAKPAAKAPKAAAK